jgi:hypothetical protein
MNDPDGDAGAATFTASHDGACDDAVRLTVEVSRELRPPSGQSEDDGMQGQSYRRPDHRAVDADVLQIAPEEQFQLA